MNQIIKREVTLGQLITVGISLLVMIAGSWVNMSNRIQALEIKTNYRETDINIIINKIDKIQEDINCIKIDMKGKVDK